MHTPVSACSSGAEAIAYAVDMIRNGRADVVVAGGTEAAIHPLPLAGFAAMQALSTRNDEPERASRPYDKGRDGFVLGEGAGVVVLETARARAGARRDASTPRSPAPASPPTPTTSRSPTRSVPARPAPCGWRSRPPAPTPADVVHINAHATSTPVGDVAEAAGDPQRPSATRPTASACRRPSR